MASPRLAGGTSVTSRPSISMWPDETSSSPAMRRSSVDLPQPEGPTKTTNSPSSMARSRGGMTSVSPKDLVMRLRVMRPITSRLRR